MERPRGSRLGAFSFGMGGHVLRLSPCGRPGRNGYLYNMFHCLLRKRDFGSVKNLSHFGSRDDGSLGLIRE